jgi:AraC-like DNA-binding protein
MEQLSKLTMDGKYDIQESRFSVIGSYWSNIVSFYPYHRIYLVTDGAARLVTKDKLIPLEKNRLYYIAENSIVSGVTESTLSHYYVHFRVEPPLGNILKLLLPASIPNAGPANELAFKILCECAESTDPYDALRCDAALKILLAGFLAGVTAYNQSMLKFMDTIAYINAHICERVTIVELAGRLNFNPTYFSNTFKRSFGITLQQYIILQKLEYACTRLLTTEQSISQISEDLQFADEPHFSRLFKKHFGVPPSKFRGSVPSSVGGSFHANPHGIRL